MNKDLAEAVKTYATKDHREFSTLLLNKSKDNVISILIDLMTLYFNDKNSSTLREYVLVVLAGFIPSERKIGHNGYKQTTIGDKSEYCEAKPKNINTNNSKIKKLDGSGNFTDFTFERLKRNKEDNPLMLVGGYIDGRLIYVFKFPFKSKSFTDKLEAQLLERFEEGKDIRGQFLRSATFSLKNYKDIEELELEVFVSQEVLANYKDYITGPLYSILIEAV